MCCEGGRLANELHCDEFHDAAHKTMDKTNPYWPRISAQVDPVAHGKGVMLRTERYKYVARLYEPDELYDLAEDPGEQVNRIGDPALADVAAQMKERALRWLIETADAVPFDFDCRLSTEMAWARLRRMGPRAARGGDARQARRRREPQHPHERVPRPLRGAVKPAPPAQGALCASRIKRPRFSFSKENRAFFCPDGVTSGWRFR